MASFTEIAKKKNQYVLEREQLLIKSTRTLQENLYLRILERIIETLEIESGIVKPTKANIISVSKIETIYREFFNQDMSETIKEYIKDLGGIRQMNREYFESFDIKPLGTPAGRINTSINFRIGLDERGRIIPGGFLDSFIKDPIVRNQIKMQMLRGITGGQSKPDLIKSIRTLIKGSGSGTETIEGNLLRYFKTFLTDTYSIYDAQISDAYAIVLDMNYAIYAGTIIETSRPFCIERKDKVFTRAEIAMFGTSSDKYGGYSNKSRGEFQGKPKNYNPFRDRGGYNCRDQYNWITYDQAVRLRPDLKKP